MKCSAETRLCFNRVRNSGKRMLRGPRALVLYIARIFADSAHVFMIAIRFTVGEDYRWLYSDIRLRAIFVSILFCTCLATVHKL